MSQPDACHTEHPQTRAEVLVPEQKKRKQPSCKTSPTYTIRGWNIDHTDQTLLDIGNMCLQSTKKDRCRFAAWKDRSPKITELAALVEVSVDTALQRKLLKHTLLQGARMQRLCGDDLPTGRSNATKHQAGLKSNIGWGSLSRVACLPVDLDDTAMVFIAKAP